jgi:leucyl-tRNA synthetase
MKKYNHQQIEKKWQKYWEEKNIFKTNDKAKGKKKYILDMFPYPSGAGLHVGHPEGYTATDILARYSRMNGFNVLHPMGWDSFGLPAENYAIKMGVHPQKTTQKNIKRFTSQIKSIGLSYDWSRELNTSDPEYYKWTQWLFLQFYKKGLAYKKLAAVNWCPKDHTVLANEQVVDGKCERCGSEVIQKKLSQWFFKITDYAEELLSEIDKLDWPEPIKLIQRNWIGKSQGAEIDFSVIVSSAEAIPQKEKLDGELIEQNGQKPHLMNVKEPVILQTLAPSIKVFTTRADTLFGATYIVLAPEHELVQNLKSQISNFNEVEKYIEETKKKSELQRTQLEKEKTGVELKGIKAINPATKEEIPVWIADYVITGYGTGAIMAVPAHDQRDGEFAKKFNLPIKRVVEPFVDGVVNYAGLLNKDVAEKTEYVLFHSGKFTGMVSEQAKAAIANEFGNLKTQYKLRDWLVSRQRYWGAPIPIVYCEKCGEQPVLEKDLPVKLPTDVDFRPTGESPLKISKKFKNAKCPKCGEKAERDYDTMDTFVDSSWYFLRYTDNKNKKVFADKKKIKSWAPVDMYVGGAEHAVMHLLYARFFTKVLRDLGYLNFGEPFLALKNQGLILGPDGEKMSKSRGNVVNPDDVIKESGADSLRMYEMFMGPFEDAKPWQTNGIVGVKRFLERVYGWVNQNIEVRGKRQESEKINRELHKLIKKVTEDIEGFHFNTSVSAFMQFHNDIKDEPVSKEFIKTFLTLLYPFAPHITEELNQIISKPYSAKASKGKSNNHKSLQLSKWPKFDPALVIDNEIEVIVQVNGKVKGKITAQRGASEEVVKSSALQIDAVKQTIGTQEIKRVINVPNRLINFVV